MQVFNSFRSYLQSNNNCGIIQSNTQLNNNVLDNTWNVLQVRETFLYYKHKTPPDTTFIIQGLPHPETYLNLVLSTLQFGNVILSTWDTLDLNKVKTHIANNNIENRQNIYLQVFTTLDGLNQCTSKYAIKIRADEWYKDFSSFISNMKNNSNKIITHNMFFRTLGQYPYHISDHIIGGLTENLLKMFESAKYMLENKQSLPNIQYMYAHCPEQWLTVAYIKCFYTDQELYHNIRNKMIEHFHIVPIGTFKDFLLRYTWYNQRLIIQGPNDLKNHSHAFAITDITKIAPPNFSEYFLIHFN